MRIAYLLADPGIPVGGTKGASVHVAEVCAAFGRRDATVALFAARVTGRPPAGTTLVHLDAGSLRKGDSTVRLAAASDFAARVTPAVARFAPDLIYERLALGSAGSATLAASLGVPRLVEVNAPVVDEWLTQHPLQMADAVRLRQRRALAGARVVAVSAPLAQWSLTQGAAAAIVLGNGVDVQHFALAAQARRPTRVGLGLEGAEVVGFVGSLKPWHGVPVLLAAAARLAPSRPKLRVLIVGDGPQRAALFAQASRTPLRGRVVFTGAVDPGRVPSHLGAMDVATAPFLPSNGFYFSPMKVPEAMAAARPVIASDFVPIAKMLGDTGVLVAPADSAALAAALTRLLDDPAAAAALGVRARARATAQLSWDRVIEQTLAFAAQTTLDGVR